MSFASRPAGIAEGALSGQYPAPGPGLIPAAGISIQEDFLATDSSASRQGDLQWTSTTLGNGGGYVSAAPTTAYEHGIIQLTTLAVATGDGIVYDLGDDSSPIFNSVKVPAGVCFCVKLKMTSTSAYEVWAGVVQNQGSNVKVATAVEFIGVRSVGANLFGVVKVGAASETTVDLGAACESGYITCGFEMLRDNTVQFFTLDTPNLKGSWSRTDIGSAVSTSLLVSTTGSPTFGLITTAAAAKVGKFDFYTLAGRIDR